jgi:TetR/AcrR family transcriptional regulator, transcriptional repressor of bet genes
VSAGMVQHYFKSKDEMLRFTCEYLAELARDRFLARLAATPDAPPPRTAVRDLFVDQLPFDAGRRAGVQVWIAFLSRALAEPSLAGFLRETYAATHAFVAGQLRAAQSAGELAADLDPEAEAAGLVCLVDGLVTHVMIGHYPADEALAVVDARLARLWETGGG